ncbi:MAG: translational GTPase TypA [Candidatus Gracilibacteria bacterium]
MEIRNIAIIAHVDHGKTTLVDALLKAGGAFQAHETIEVRVMDSNDQEKERGITIYAKNAAIHYKGNKINIVDTPGHADFGSEVERILRTVDATVLVVDAYEGPMPQTKFVLRKSLELGLKVLVVINKIDKPTARPDQVLNEIFDLFVSLGANDKQLDFPYIYAIAREGIAIRHLTDERKDILPLLDFIVEHVEAAAHDTEKPFRMQPATLAYDSYLGRIAMGRVYEGKLQTGKMLTITDSEGKKRQARATKLFTYQGIERVEVPEVVAGDFVAIAGISDVDVGETIATDENAETLPAIKIDPPAISVEFLVNNSPFAGREGKYVTSRHIRERLERELETNVGLKIEGVKDSDTLMVYARGEMQIAVLIENMRREGYELQISQPKVIMREIDGQKMEPYELAVINVPDSDAGKVIEAMGKRKGEMTNMRSGDGNTLLEFEIPTRGLLGFRSQFLIMTSGEGTIYHSFDHFGPYKGTIDKRTVGSMIAGEPGKAMAYSIWKLQERGPFFIVPQVEVYEGMIIGEHNQGTDIVVNVTKNKKLTNVRASGTDEALALTPISPMTLEKAIEYIKDDEYAEITPKSIRLRKKYLTEIERKRFGNKDQ